MDEEYPANLLREFTGDPEYQKRKVAEGLAALEQIRQENEKDLLQVNMRREAQLNEILESEKKIMSKYYVKNVCESRKFFRRHFPPSVDAVVGKTVNQQDGPIFNMQSEYVEPLLHTLTEILPSQIQEEYMDMHNAAYRQKLESMTSQINPDKIDKLRSAKITICIAARNEVSLTRTLTAIEKSYGPDYINDIAVVVYHNHSGEYKGLPPDVLADIEMAKLLSNVIIVDNEPEAGTSTPEIKKTAADLLINFLPPENNPYILFADADIVEMSPEAIQKSISLLKKTKAPFGAISVSELPDSTLADTFPLLYEYQNINNHVLDYQIINNHRQPVTIGGFTLTDKVSFLASGGWIPEEIHEDMRFTQQLTMATCGYAQGRHPVKDAHLDENVQVRFNPSRQVEAQLAGISGSTFSEKNYNNRTGKKRLDWKKLSVTNTRSSPLLTHEVTADGRLIMFHKFLTDNYPPNIRNWTARAYASSRIPETQRGFLDYLIKFSDLKSWSFKTYDFVARKENIINTNTIDLMNIDLSSQAIVEILEAK